MHITLRQKGQSQSIFNQSEGPSPKSQSICHQCEYYFALNKAHKIINRKNREIQTLNRIIKNLKTQVNELTDNKQKHKIQTQNYKNEITIVKAKLLQMEMRQLDNQRAVCQQRLQSALKVKNNTSRGQSKIFRECSPQYYSECHVSRNTEDQRIPNIQIQKMKMYQNSSNFIRTPKQNSNSMTMGELFMGRKLKIEMDNKINRHSSWGQMQLLNQPRIPPYKLNDKGFLLQNNHFDNRNKMNLEEALMYLKRQNQNLKTPIY